MRWCCTCRNLAALLCMRTMLFFPLHFPLCSSDRSTCVAVLTGPSQSLLCHLKYQRAADASGVAVLYAGVTQGQSFACRAVGQPPAQGDLLSSAHTAHEASLCWRYVYDGNAPKHMEPFLSQLSSLHRTNSLWKSPRQFFRAPDPAVP